MKIIQKIKKINYFKAFYSIIVVWGLLYLANQGVNIIKSSTSDNLPPIVILQMDVPEEIKKDVNEFAYFTSAVGLPNRLDGWNFTIFHEDKYNLFTGTLMDTNKEEYNSNLLGFCDDINKNIILHQQLFEKSKYEIRAVVFHELLHCLYGINHSFSLGEDGNPDTLMYPSAVLTEEYLKKHWLVLVGNSLALYKPEQEKINHLNFLVDTTTSLDYKSITIDNLKAWKDHISLEQVLGFFFLLYSIIYTLASHIHKGL